MRKNDVDNKTYFRSADRLVNLNGSWSFLTRDGECGPFFREEDAKIALKRFVIDKIWHETQKESKRASRAIRPKVNTYAFANRPDVMEYE